MSSTSKASWFSRFTPGSLAARVFLLYATVLGLFLGLGMGLFYFYQFTQKLDDTQDAASVVGEITAQAIRESVVIGDYDALRLTLARALNGTAFKEASFIDLKGGRVSITRRSGKAEAVPGWLLSQVSERLFDVNMTIVVGGHDYGVLRLRFDEERVATDLWKLTQAALALGALCLAGGLAALRFPLSRWLLNLSRLKTLEERIVAGDAAAAELPAGVPTEIRETFEAFSRTAESLRSQYGQRIDTLAQALVQQKKALDLTAIVAELGPDGRVLAVNDLFYTTLGTRPGTIVGKVLYGLGDHPGETLNGQIWRGTVGTTDIQGRNLWFRRTIVPARDLNEAVEKWICIDLDITAQKQAEEQVRDTYARSKEMAESHLRALIDTIGDGFALLDEDGRVVVSNQRFLHFHPPGQPFLPRPGAPSRVEQAVDGRWMRATEYFGPHGSVIGLYTDITQQVQLEQEMRLAMEQAEAGSRAKSEFLATMSHEIRTPMNGVIGMTGLLLDTKMSAEQRHFAETIRDSAESLLTIINDILDFSKMEAGKLDLDYSEFDLPTLVESVVEILAPRAHAKGIEIACLVDPALRRSLRGDPGRIRQILMNLAGNGVKFTHQGGVSIEVTARGSVEGTRMIRLEIRDTGIGIAAEARDRLFSMFSQVDTSTARRYGGTGLGLAISRRLAELMNGAIGVESEPGKGSRFWVTLPLEETGPSLPLPAELAGRRVLVVDDNAVNRDVIERQLRSFGLLVASTADAAAALVELERAAAVGQPWEVAVIDARMPGESGPELVARLRARPAFSGLKIVLTSSQGLASETKDDRTAYDAFLYKPLRQSSLLDALGRALEIGGDWTGPAAEEFPGDAAAPAGRRLRILVAEDNPVNQQVALGLLRKLGHSVDVAGDGAEAVEAVRQRPYDLILMDMQMPEMDGLEATRLIRSLAIPASAIPIVAMTANAMRGDDQKCFDAGMNGYISKPIDRRKLVDLIARHADGIEALAAATTALPSSEPAKAVDFAVLDALAEDIGHDTVIAILERFLTDSRDRQQSAAAARAAGDREALAREAHTIKGAAASLGLLAIRDCSLELERASRDSAGAAAPALDRLGGCIDALPGQLAGTPYPLTAS